MKIVILMLIGGFLYLTMNALNFKFNIYENVMGGLGNKGGKKMKKVTKKPVTTGESHDVETHKVKKVTKKTVTTEESSKNESQKVKV